MAMIAFRPRIQSGIGVRGMLRKQTEPHSYFSYSQNSTIKPTAVVPQTQPILTSAELAAAEQVLVKIGEVIVVVGVAVGMAKSAIPKRK